MADRNAKGQFLPGNSESPGRKGCPNVTSRAVIQRFLDTLYSLDDTVESQDWLKQFAQDNPKAFIQAVQQCLPRQVEEKHDHYLHDDREQPELVRLLDAMRGQLLLPEGEVLEGVMVETTGLSAEQRERIDRLGEVENERDDRH